MSKTFRAWKIDQPLLLPPMAQDFVDKDHLARFVASLVTEQLDLIEITVTYSSEKGGKGSFRGPRRLDAAQNALHSVAAM